MADRSAGTRSWSLSPYQVDVRFDKLPQPARTGWFGPLEPITPLAPPDVAGRQWDYPSGYNLATTVAQLRGRSPSRRCAVSPTAMIFCGSSSRRARTRPRVNPGRFLPRDKTASAAANAARIAAATQFFAKPDGRHGFADWLRILLEEVFVTDAAALYMRRDRGGRLAGLLPLDGGDDQAGHRRLRAARRSPIWRMARWSIPPPISRC